MTYLGQCRYCHAPIYADSNGKLVVKDPAPDCLCCLEGVKREEDDK
jgi:hypothetical protein